MNKKRLSVVMAGAMLATSVAPVLAAETTGTEIAFDQLATFKSDLLAKMAEKKISDYAIFTTGSTKDAPAFVDDEIAKEIRDNDAAGEFSSAYGIKIIGKDGRVKLPTIYTTDAKKLENALDALKSGDKVEVYERETTNFKGQLLPGKGLDNDSELVKSTYVENDFVGDSNQKNTKEMIKVTGSKIVNDVTFDGPFANVKTNKPDSITEGTFYSFKLNIKDTRVDGRLPLDKDGNLLDVTKIEDAAKFKNFENYYNNWNPCKEASDKGAKVVETYTIGEKVADGEKETLKVEDLFDGIALTARGTELVADLKNAEKALDEEGDKNKEAALVQLDNRFTDTNKIFEDAATATTGIKKFTIAYYKNGELAKDAVDATTTAELENTKKAAEKLITVVSSDVSELEGLYKILSNNEFNVGVVAGQNRYETAVNVAKQQNLTFNDSSHIVLVNGESLVDGLSAAPLAANKSASLLLTQSDKLPTATKEYIEELIKDLSPLEKKNVTIDLVGGSSVLETSLVNELKEMGLRKIVRYGGENREETSIAIAKALGTKTKAFVVGANGEADAMSVSAVAAENQTPIIVAKAGGISEAALDYLEEVNADDVTIIGGTSVLSEAEETKINKALKAAKAMRIAGKNRIETNNAIVKEYYKANAKGVVVVKDGIAKKGELVDALSAANYAAKIDAPILLASTNVTDVQKNTLLKSINSSEKNKKVVQIGLGAERNVLETLADLLGASNKFEK